MIMVDSSYAERLKLFEEIFQPSRIIINHQRFDSFKKLVDWCLEIVYPFVEEEIEFKELKERAENSSSFSTVFENGLFIPHLKIENVKRFYSLFITLSDFYPIEPKTKRSVKVIFILISPLEQSFFEKHLNILALVSSLLRDTDTIKKLSEFKTADDIYSYLKNLI